MARVLVLDVRVALECEAGPLRQQGHAGCVLQRHHLDLLGQRPHHLGGERLDLLRHAKEHVGAVERAHVGRSEREVVRRGGALHQQRGQADVGHDVRDQGVQRLDGYNDFGVAGSPSGRRHGQGCKSGDQDRDCQPWQPRHTARSPHRHTFPRYGRGQVTLCRLEAVWQSGIS